MNYCSRPTCCGEVVDPVLVDDEALCAVVKAAAF